jgi:AcrR family transcriptional regulator
MVRKPTHARGAREIARLERFEAIRRAANDLFLKKGYEATTLRMIAAEANVGLATIFRHVQDKRDLLYLLFNDQHLEVTRRASMGVDSAKPFLDQCIDGFRHYYRYFGANPEFSRSVLREITFYVPRPGNRAFEALQRSTSRILEIVSHARIRGEIDCPMDDAAIAHLIFEIYQMECRHWLFADKPNVEDGLARLRETLEVVARGICPRVSAQRSRRRVRA